MSQSAVGTPQSPVPSFSAPGSEAPALLMTGIAPALSSASSYHKHMMKPIQQVECQGAFPEPGSMLGPYFCLGRLGKGTFCSIHKCIDMNYLYQCNGSSGSNATKKPRLVAAKVELDNYTDSGVLEGEGQILSHLDHRVKPKTVPIYMGLYVSNTPSHTASALVMEFLGGEDMHQLRDATGGRRMTGEDAVYLSAHVLLPLLREMHMAGVVHRDVKPSNCVRRDYKEFAMVDFGLSKSIVVDEGHHDAGGDFSGSLKLRNERPSAEFRGTSMYASLRVHQGKDYSFRDDMWSLLYVFCDLITGGLPWMSYAANRDREACQRAKEEVHGDDNGANDKTEIMLMGEDYFLAKYKHDMAKKEGKEFNADLPEPLELAKDVEKVELLRKCFKHVASLGFNDMPDYDFLQRNLIGFLDNPPQEKTIVKPVIWKSKVTNLPQINSQKSATAWDRNVPTWELNDYTDDDPLETESETLWTEAESQVVPVTSIYGASTEAADLARLPLQFQFRIAQMNHHRRNRRKTPPRVALRDWMKCALHLVYGEWDCQKFERGNHRANTDGYRRDLFSKLVDQCLQCASAFQNWTDLALYYEDGSTMAVGNKKRMLSSTDPGSNGSVMISVSKVLGFLYLAKMVESKKNSPPPPSLSHAYRA